MAAPKKANPLSHPIHVRFPESWWEPLCGEAKRMGGTVSDLVRAAVQEFMRTRTVRTGKEKNEARGR